MLENIFSRLKRQNSDSLVIELKLAARANPDDAETRVQLGLAYQNLGQLSKAIKAYLSALEIHPKFVTAYKNLGAAYDELGQFVDALKAYTKAIMLAPQDAELRNDLGLVYFNIGSYAEAIKAFRQALDIEPDNGRAHFCLGLVYLDLGDTKMALMEHGQIDSHRDPHLADELMDKIHLQSSKPQDLHREM